MMYAYGTKTQLRQSSSSSSISMRRLFRSSLPSQTRWMVIAYCMIVIRHTVFIYIVVPILHWIVQLHTVHSQHTVICMCRQLPTYISTTYNQMSDFIVTLTFGVQVMAILTNFGYRLFYTTALRNDTFCMPNFRHSNFFKKCSKIRLNRLLHFRTIAKILTDTHFSVSYNFGGSAPIFTPIFIQPLWRIPYRLTLVSSKSVHS